MGAYGILACDFVPTSIFVPQKRANNCQRICNPLGSLHLFRGLRQEAYSEDVARGVALALWRLP